MWARRLLRGIGACSILVGLGTIAYAHLQVAPDLRRSVDILRGTTSDAAAAADVLLQMAVATDAVRAPSEDVTRRTVATLAPAIALLDRLAATLRVLPGGSDESTVGSLARRIVGAGGDDGRDEETDRATLERAVAELGTEARRLRTVALALEAEMDRHTIPSLQPAAAAAAARFRETADLLMETNPARGMTLLADLIAGIYVVVGAALVVGAPGRSET